MNGSRTRFLVRYNFVMDLTQVEKRVLLAIAQGWTLKSHRFLDGRKVYRLHPLDEGDEESVAWETVDALRDKELIDSNKKFPAATYLLTDKGKEVVEGSGFPAEQHPLTASGWR